MERTVWSDDTASDSRAAPPRNTAAYGSEIRSAKCARCGPLTVSLHTSHRRLTPDPDTASWSYADGRLLDLLGRRRGAARRSGGGWRGGRGRAGGRGGGAW